MKVQFNSIGRNKLSWKADLPNASERIILREIASKNALMSRDVQAVHDNDTNTGNIYAGMRLVGTYQVVFEN